MKCENCAHWARYGGDYIVKHLGPERPWGECGRSRAPDALMRVDGAFEPEDEYGPSLDTHETFGCVQFEERKA